MTNSIPHTIKLQDGSLCNLSKRIAKQGGSLITILALAVTEQRRAQGIRHSLVLILLIVFVGLLTGSKDLKDACLFARYNQRLFEKLLSAPLPYGIPNPTTVSRALRKLDSEELVTVGVQFLQILGIPLGDVYSFDGKTMRAVSGEDAIRHMLSLFSHDNHLAVGQVGVGSKENEIPALERLLDQGKQHDLIAGKLLIGDALHTQKATVKTILKARADYLFVVKGNQKQLRRAITAELNIRPAVAIGSYTHYDTKRKRNTTTTVTAITVEPGEEMLPTLKRSNHWDGVRTMGILRRTGTRISKDGTIHKIDETIGFISSRVLTAERVTIHLHKHWCIENNLHWVKDEVFGEDKHTLRRGNAPQVMSWMRSLAISLCNALKLKSISDTIHNLQKSSVLLDQFLYMAAVV
jgi:predicted transposase YbfD/YdcC